MAFGHYLRRQREERGMTLTELARRVEISIAYLSRIERERENPPPDHLISALAGALSPEWASLYRGLAISAVFRKTMISRTIFCSAQAAVIRLARTGPMPVTSLSRSGSASMVSNTFSPKGALASWRRPDRCRGSSQILDTVRCHRAK
jgi:transcriptional regulator with XRE-family HTH domain